MPVRNNILSFTGNLPRSIERAVSQWKELFTKKYGDFGVSGLLLSEAAPEEILAEFTAPAFLVSKRMLILDVSWNPVDGKNAEVFGKQAYWDKAFECLSADTTVIFKWFPAEQEPEFGKKSPPKKKEKKNGMSHEGLLASLALWWKNKTYEIAGESSAVEFVQEKLPDISDRLARLLVTRIGSNFPELIENEAIKLSLIETISEQDILQNTIENPEVSAFNILDAILTDNRKLAVVLLQKNLQKVDGIEFLRSFFGALRKPVFFCACLQAGLSERESLIATKINEYAAKKYRSLSPARRKSLIQLYLDCIQLDEAGKTGKLVGDREGYEHGLLASIIGFGVTEQGNLL